MQFCNLRGHDGGMFDGNIDFVKESLTAMSALLESRGIDFVVAMFPDEFQVNSNLREELKTRLERSRSDFDMQLPQRLVGDHLQTQPVSVIDLLDPCVERGKTERLYLLRDTHWKRAGRQLAGELIFAELSQRLDRIGDFEDEHRVRDQSTSTGLRN